MDYPTSLDHQIKLVSLDILCICPQYYADSLKGGYGACISEELFDQLTTAAVKKDERAWNYLMNNGCLIPKAGIPITILDTTWTGTAKVRAYVGDQAIILWTNTENVQRN